MAVLLEFYRLGFRFLAQQRLAFPPGKAGNVLRGAFGSILREQSCRPQCSGAGHCPSPEGCAYAAIFEPRAGGRFTNLPRPFVFRADHLDGRTIAAGQPFEFGMNLFDRSPTVVDHVVKAFSAIDALGARRSAAKFLHQQLCPTSFDLTPSDNPVNRVQVWFRTPTALKANNEIADRPEFPILYARAAERLNALGAHPVPVLSYDNIQMTGCSIVTSYTERHSSKTGQWHRLGGFTGSATYEGDLRQSLPVLKAAEFTGVGRHASWGNGRLDIVVLD